MRSSWARANGDKAVLAAVFADAAVERGARAGEVVREAAGVIGGGGGGRDDVAQAGGDDPAKFDEALEVAGRAIERALAS